MEEAKDQFFLINKLIKNLISSNSGEGIIIKNDYSKGVIIRGYKPKDFPKLEIINDKSFIGKPKSFFCFAK